MSAVNDDFTLPHDVEAIYDSLHLELDDPKMKRRVTDALAQLVENNRAIEGRANGGVGLWPIYTSDPATPSDGQSWINSTTGKARVRINGATVSLN